MDSGAYHFTRRRENGIAMLIAVSIVFAFIDPAGTVRAAESSSTPIYAKRADDTPSADITASEAGSASGQDQINELVVTGDRGSQRRTVANSPVPIDIISGEQLTATGKTGLKEILSSVVPSFTVPAQNGGGTSASVAPYTVRGLTGDFVLVLINGKRRHSTALINNLATIGAGSTPVDLDLIPIAAIDHIEVLRDGAAAQYGSDAIAGVINIILKTGRGGRRRRCNSRQALMRIRGPWVR